MFNAIIEGAEKPEATNIRWKFVNIVGKFFDCREMVITNIERMAALAAKSQGCGVRLHINLRAVVILANI